MTFIDQTVGNSSIIRYALRTPSFDVREMLNPVTLYLATLADQRGPTSSGSVILFDALAAAGAVVYRAWFQDYRSSDDIARYIGTEVRRGSVRVRLAIDEEMRIIRAYFSPQRPDPRRRTNSSVH